MPVLEEAKTHDDIQGVVNDIVEARKDKPEDGSEEKGDSQKIAEERDKPVTTETAAETGNEEDAASDGDETWLDDDLKAEVAARGIDETELAGITSRDELDRAMRFLDKAALEAGRKAKAKSGNAKEEKPEENKSKDGQYEISINKELFDEELVEEFTKMRDHYETRMTALEARFQQADAQAVEQRFDSIVDSMGHKDLFGISGKESEKEHERRSSLFEEAEALQLGMQVQGRSVDLDAALVNRVARMVFAEELGKKDLKARTRKLASQGDGRMGGGATKAHNSTESRKEAARRKWKELEDAG